MGIENRKQRRVILRRNVIINGSSKMMGLDLSQGGLYVHTGRSFKPGTIVSISIPLSAKPVNLKASVQHSEDGIGMGLMFLEPPAEALAEIREFIDLHREAYADLVRKKVLIVDDSAITRKMNKSKLVLDGLTVLEAVDGIEAIAVLERERVDLVVLDLYMERMDGFKVLHLIREKPDWKGLPVLVLSSKSNPGEVERAMNAGATEFLVKMTTTPLKLSERVQRHLGSK